MTWLRCNSAYGRAAAEAIAKLDAKQVETALSAANADDEATRQVRKTFDDLVKAVRAVTGNVVGSAQSRRNSREEIWAMIHKYGRPAVSILIR